MRALRGYRGFILLAVVLSTAGTGCAASPSPATTPQASASASAGHLPEQEGTAAPIRVAVAGDSNSTGFAGTLEHGVASSTAWVALLPEGEFEWAGGWALDGATSLTVADNVVPIGDADVLVVMVGTNDLALGIPFDQTRAAVEAIVETVGAELPVISALAPSAYQPEEVEQANQDLAAVAAQNGWGWIDPWVPVRGSDGGWLPAFFTDGVHTSSDGYAAAASEVATQLRELVDISP